MIYAEYEKHLSQRRRNFLHAQKRSSIIQLDEKIIGESSQDVSAVSFYHYYFFWNFYHDKFTLSHWQVPSCCLSLIAWKELSFWTLT